MRIRIACYEDPQDWILGKFATSLESQLVSWGIDAKVVRRPNGDADLNHHIAYNSFTGTTGKIDTLMVTHVDSVGSLRRLGAHLSCPTTVGICMSSDTLSKLVGAGLPGRRLCYVSPAHDGVIRPRPLRVGILSRLYADGRKRESELLASFSRLPASDFTFVIMGSGWDDVVVDLRAGGHSVEYHPQFDYNTYVELVPHLDYFAYFSHDEGSMGFLDAVAAGVRTLVTPQGFHLDPPDGIWRPINDPSDLSRALLEIAMKRRRYVNGVAHWTWERYARKHLEIWSHLLEERCRAPDDGVADNEPDGVSSLNRRPGSARLRERAEFALSLVRTSLARRLRRGRDGGRSAASKRR